MQNFVVSSRKYRPSTFDTVVGQSHISNTLKNAIKSNHLAHAFLFCGPRGVGKTTSARILAKTINCLNLTADTEPCNACESCVSFNNNQSFNIYELDAASNNSVDDIRMLVEQVRYPPQGVKYKVYIIDEVHMLSTQAFNAFLKTLEEPPEYAIFILATTERHKVIPTILSRCQIFNFNKITIDDMVKHLKDICIKEDVEAEEDALHVIGQKSDGSLRDALTIFDQMVSFSGNKITYKDAVQNLNILDYDYYFSVTDAIANQNLPQVLNTFDEILSRGFDGHLFLNGLSEHLRNLLVCKTPETIKLMEVTDNVAKRFEKQGGGIQSSFILNALNICNQADLQYKAVRNQRLHIEIALIKMCHINSVIELKANGDLPQDSTEKKKTESIASAKPEEPVSTYNFRQTSPASTGINLNPDRNELLEKLKKQRQQPVLTGLECDADKDEPQPEVILNELSDTVLRSVLAAFKEKLATEQKKMLVNMMDNFKFELSGGTHLNITVEGSHNGNMMEDERLNLIGFIYQQTGVRPTIQLVIVQVEQGKNVYFTPEEKFKKLLEDNPVLRDFSKELDIRPE